MIHLASFDLEEIWCWLWDGDLVCILNWRYNVYKYCYHITNMWPSYNEQWFYVWCVRAGLIFHDPNEEKKTWNVIHITQSTSSCLPDICVFDQWVRTKIVFDIGYVPISWGSTLTPVYLDRNQLYCVLFSSSFQQLK